MSNADIFRAAEWDCQLTSCKLAEELLSRLSGSMTASELNQALRVLDQAGKTQTLARFPAERVQRIKDKLAEHIAHGDSPAEGDGCRESTR
jgi:hypothetical protein